MAALGLGLCLILTLWMTGSRPPTAIPPRSPDPSHWWDQGSLQIQKEALRLRKAGDYRAAESVYRQGYREAVRLGDKLATVRYLMSVGGCQFGDYRYRAALASFLEARDLARGIGDRQDLGAIAVNLSSLYLQVWDVPAALRAADEGLAESAATAKDGNSYFEPALLLQLGRLHATLRDGLADRFYVDGIAAARAHMNTEVEAVIWDLLGEERLAAQQLDAAGQAFGEAHRLQLLFNPAQLGFAYSHLGALALARGQLKTADLLISRALDAARRGAPAWPEYLLLNQRGRIRLARGQEDAALADFSAALDSVSRWRKEVLPARSSLTSSNVALDAQVFRSFIETAAARAVATGSRAWAERAFQAVELNRAASLRASLALAEVWKKKLPPEYWDLLGELGAEEALTLRGVRPNTRADRLRLKLTEMEAQAGVGLNPNKDENFLSRTSLIHFQEGLRDSELLLSFSLGRKESYLWAVSRGRVRLYRLAGEQEIANAVQAFREALPAGGAEAIRRGQRLYLQLFGQLKPRERKTTEWLLSLEGALFNIPFAALVTEQQDGNTVYLVDQHSVQTIPGALLWRASAESARSGGINGGKLTGGFLGVGDPIYNAADPRWHGPARLPAGTGELHRLVESGGEVEASARGWAAGSGTRTLLTGPEASRANFLDSLERRPAVIHLATHVVSAGKDLAQAFVAFSLARSRTGGSPAPEYLDTSEIAGLSVPGALVVMTGCATGTGDARAGAGLLGLTRAWLMAGARNVISTAWPVEDTSGEMFDRFYHYLHDQPAAEALRRSQREVAHSGTWRAAPSYWASYQVTGGSR